MSWSCSGCWAFQNHPVVFMYSPQTVGVHLVQQSINEHKLEILYTFFGGGGVKTVIHCVP